MAQTQQQIRSGFLLASYHLEVQLDALPEPPLRSGPLEFGATVRECYKSPAPLARGTRITVVLPVVIPGHPAPPGLRHLLWTELCSEQWIELLANEAGAAIRAVDGGWKLLSGPVGSPSLL